jgi:hypothetical protein
MIAFSLPSDHLLWQTPHAFRHTRVMPFYRLVEFNHEAKASV